MPPQSQIEGAPVRDDRPSVIEEVLAKRQHQIPLGVNEPVHVPITVAHPNQGLTLVNAERALLLSAQELLVTGCENRQGLVMAPFSDVIEPHRLPSTPDR